jgi:hypothetical protein
MKRKLEYEDMVPGLVIEKKDSPGQFFTIGTSVNRHSGVGHATYYQLFNSEGRELGNGFPMSWLREHYHKPKPDKK